MIRIIRTRTLAEAAAETARFRLAWQETERTLAVYRDSLGDALNELYSLRNAHQAVSDQARDWEAQYRAVVEGIGAWIGEVQSAMAQPETGGDFQGKLAVALWRSFVERAEEAGEADDTAVRLIKLLVVDDPAPTPTPQGEESPDVQTSRNPSVTHAPGCVRAGFYNTGCCGTIELPGGDS